MNRITTNPFLRGALAIDAVASGAMGLLLTALPARLAALFALPETLLLEAGVFLIVYAIFVAILAALERVPSALVWLVIAGNVLWAVQSVVLVASGWLAPSAVGIGFVLAQAAAVAVFAELQFVGLRRARALAAA